MQERSAPADSGVGATVLGALRNATALLEAGRIESPRLNADLLMSHLLSCERIDLYLKYDTVLGAAELEKFQRLVRRRIGHEPVQYITGESDFMGLRLRVDPTVLIPRPETEILVEKVVEECLGGLDHGAILDVGTGSGNIAIALAKFLPGSIVVTMDVAWPGVARANIERHELREHVLPVVGNALAGLPFQPQSFDVLVSNPPYIPASELMELDPEVRDHESPLALTDGADGLSFFRALGRSAHTVLRPGGLLAVETAYNQSEAVRAIFEDSGLLECRISPDLSGVGRVVRGLVR